MTRADHLARRGLEHEAAEHVRWAPLTEPARLRLPVPARTGSLRLLGLCALFLTASVPWLRVLSLILRSFQQ